MLYLNKVSYSYESNEYYAVNNINLKLEKGEHLSIIGPNGCGKTTLLKCVANIFEYEGEIFLEGREIRTIDRKKLARNISYLTQMTSIYFPYTVYETVAQGRYPYLKGIFANLSKEDEAEINRSLEMVGMHNFANEKITKLSGGQLQRVFLARAFAQNPDIILLDEPTNHLDLKNQIELLEHLKNWVTSGEKSVISVLHDLNLVQMYSDNVVLMQYGKVFSQGSREEVLTKENLQTVYSHDINSWMRGVLEKWKI